MKKPFSPSADRNKGPILKVLEVELCSASNVLEIGSGTGQHACFFASQLPHIVWQPTELRHNLTTIRNRVDEQQAENILTPVELDVNNHPWSIVDANVCYTCNTFHMISDASVRSIFKGCRAIFDLGGKLMVYGPFSVQGKHTSSSNARFDQHLRHSNSASGVKDLTELDELALDVGFASYRSVDMPNNNVLVIWERMAS